MNNAGNSGAIPRSRERGWRSLTALTTRDPVALIAVAVATYAAARIGSRLGPGPEQAFVTWPAAGIAVGGLLAGSGTRPTSRLAVIAGVAAGSTAAALRLQASLPATAALTCCTILAGLIVVGIVSRFDRSPDSMESLSGIGVLLLAALLGAGVAALPAVLVPDRLGLDTTATASAWRRLLLANALGIVTLAPMIVLTNRLIASPPPLATSLEGAAAIACATVVAAFEMGLVERERSWIDVVPTTALLPVFLWLASRSPPAFPAVGAFAVSVVGLAAAARGVGPLTNAALPMPERLEAAHISLLTGSAAVLLLAAMFADLKRSAQALQESERQLQMALAAGRMYTFDYDLVRRRIRRTGALVDRLGLETEGSIDQYIRAMLPADLVRLEEMLKGLSPQRPHMNGLLRLRAPDGTAVAVDHRVEAVFDPAGRMVRLRGACVDVTEQEAARHALEGREAQLTSALVAGRVFAFEYDPNTNLVRRSANAADILGLTQAEAQMKANLFRQHAHPDDRRLLAEYPSRMTPAMPFVSESFRFVGPSGRVAWLELMATGVFDEHGKLRLVEGIVRDNTERMRAQQQQAALVRELSHRVKNALARMVAVLRQSREGHQSIETYISAVEGRIAAMARTQEQLSSSGSARAHLAKLVHEELLPYRTPANCRIDGPDLLLPPEAAHAISLTLHELATNAAKHGALASSGGRVSVAWSVTPGDDGSRQLDLEWSETAELGIVAPTRESYGLNTIRNLLAYELGAQVDVRFPQAGLHCTIRVSLPAAGAGVTSPEDAEARR